MNAALSGRLRAICMGRDADLRAALTAIDRGGLEIAFILDESGRVLGTVTDGDVRRALLVGSTLAEPITNIMSRTFYSVTASGSHRALAFDAMVAHGIKQVPVLDEDGILVGLHIIDEYLQRDPVPNWGVVLSGGKGTRLRSITEHVPKPMLMVAGRPILERLVLDLVGAGIRTIFLAVNYKSEVVKDHFGDGSHHGCDIRYLEETEPLGTGGPLSLLPEVPQDPIIHMNGDLVGDFQFRNLLNFHSDGGHDMTIGVGLHRYVVPFGVVDREDGRVTSIREKPPKDWWINYGVYVLSPEILGLVPPNVEYPVTDLIQLCIDSERSVGAFELSGEWRDVGRPEDLTAARGGLAGR
jgi:dTDP-glucose pyrophosphorylase